MTRMTYLIIITGALMTGCSAAYSETAPKKIVAQDLVSADFYDTFSLPCTIHPVKDSVVSASVNGKVKILCAEGQHVSKGARLVSIDTSRYEALLASAEAEKEMAEKKFNRLSKLYKDGVVSSSEFDRASTTLKAAAAAYDVARINLENSFVSAPFDGIVDRLYPEEEEYAAPGTPIARIVDMTAMEALCHIPEKEISHIAAGDTVVIEHKAAEIKTQGTVSFAASTADQESRTFPVKVTIPNKDYLFYGGMIGRATFIRRKMKNAIAIPLYSVMRDESGIHVFVVENGKASRRDVSIGILKGSSVIVTQGLNSGDRLIIMGHKELRDGDKVTEEL